MKNRVKEFRKAAGMTQEELAKASMISRVYLSQIETGKQKEIGSSILFQIAKALKKDVGDIFFTEVVVLTQRRRK